VIILDTHLWVWLADENERPTEYHRDTIMVGVLDIVGYDKRSAAQ